MEYLQSRPSDDVHLTDSIGRQQAMLAVSEDGIYDAIWGSHKPEAKAFRKWVKQVIKALRKGSGLEGKGTNFVCTLCDMHKVPTT
mgnify:CR=1 FL=1